MKICESLHRSALDFGDQVALECPGQFIDYQDLLYQANCRATILHEHGVRPGDRVACHAQNSADMVLALWGIWCLGATAVPISWRYPADLVTESLKIIGSCWLTSDQPPLGIVETVRSLPPLSEISAGADHCGDHSAASDSRQHHAAATIIFTSGSSGRPKGVVHSWDNHYWSAVGANGNISLRRGDRWLINLPLFHVGGIAILFRALLSGATVVIPTDEQTITDAIDNHNPTHLSLVPAQLKTLISQPPSRKSVDLLRAILCGGDATSSNDIKAAVEAGLPLHTTYGNTEMASQVCTTRPGDTLEDLRTSGKLLPHRELHLAPDKEILLRGATLCQGYLADGRLTSATDDDGWYHSGDLGEWDANGNLRILGRRDTMFVSGGENIFPRQIEDALDSLTTVEVSIVLPNEDDRYGARPVAVVVTRPDCNRADLVSQLSSQLPRYMIPVEFYRWPPDLPRVPKPSRYRLSLMIDQGQLDPIS